MTPMLAWRDLHVRHASGSVHAVRGLSFELQRGECLALVGESGSGKTQSLLAPFGLAPGATLEGQAWFDGVDLVSATGTQVDELRGRRVGFVFQDPLSSLAPHLTLGEQLTEAARHHLGLSAAEAKQRALALLEQVQVPDPARRLRQYPHELSGGQRQRVMIAIALACDPALLVADEPTTALDASVQREVLGLLRRLQQQRGMAMLFISHDLGAVAGVADRVLVMQAGSAVEQGPCASLLAKPGQEYTRLLLDAGRLPPWPQEPPPPAPGPAALQAQDLSVRYALPRTGWRRRHHEAVAGATLAVAPGQALGIVGESGSGKSSLLRALVALQPHAGGELRWEGTPVPPGRLSAERRQSVQMVFQDALASLDPSLPVGVSVGLSVRLRHADWSAERVALRVGELLAGCGLDPALAARYPAQLSGGQAQRAAIARALGAEPRVLACDEAVSALDPTVRSQVLTLLDELRRALQLAIVFVTHDFAVVRRLCQQVVVLHEGRIVEAGASRAVLDAPCHPYTRRLLQAALHLPPALEPSQ